MVSVYCCVHIYLHALCFLLTPGYPNEEAAHVALETTREWLQTDNNADKVQTFH